MRGLLLSLGFAVLSRIGLQLERELERRAARKLAAALGRELEDVVPTLPSSDEFAVKEKYCTPGKEKLGRGTGELYRGCQTRSASGIICQKWTEQYPHKHVFSKEKNPGTGLGKHNNCRNPFGHTTIWCFTMDELERWEACEPLSCGNGKLEPFNYEYCDDGNKENDDGCSENCEIEEGFACVVDNSQAFPTSRCKNCRDGIVTGAEACDDGNGLPGDGCSPYCEIEDGWKCQTPTVDGVAGPSTCAPDVCGDGFRWIGEKCDDGNQENNDGCSWPKCRVEPGFDCTETPEGLSKCKNCGNGHMDLGEPCDDGNIENGDGCSDDCELEPGAAYEGPNGEVVGTKFSCTILISSLKVEDDSEETTTTTTSTTSGGGLRRLKGDGRRLFMNSRDESRKTQCKKVKPLHEEHMNKIIYIGGFGAFVCFVCTVGFVQYRKQKQTQLRLKKGEILIVGSDGQVKKIDTLMAIMRIQAMMRARRKRIEKRKQEEAEAEERQRQLAATTAMLQEAKMAKAMRDLKAGAPGKYVASVGPEEETDSPTKAKAGWGQPKTAGQSGEATDFI